MLTKKQINSIENKLNHASFSIKAHERRIEKLFDKSLSPEERTSEIRNLERTIHDCIVEIRAMESVLFSLGYHAIDKADDTGLIFYTIEKI